MQAGKPARSGSIVEAIYAEKAEEIVVVTVKVYYSEEVNEP